MTTALLALAHVPTDGTFHMDWGAALPFGVVLFIALAVIWALT
jgi:hypothetical protein